MEDNTIKFVVPDDASQEMKTILTAVYRSLSEKGYNPINQIVGYLLSEIPPISPITTTPAVSSASSTATSSSRSWCGTISSTDFTAQPRRPTPAACFFPHMLYPCLPFSTTSIPSA